MYRKSMVRMKKEPARAGSQSAARAAGVESAFLEGKRRGPPAPLARSLARDRAAPELALRVADGWQREVLARFRAAVRHREPRLMRGVGHDG
jgi:hypothetical protein